MNGFPEKEIRQALSSFWDDTLGDEAAISQPSDGAASVGIDELKPTMDSLTAVTVLIPLEKVLGHPLKQQLIRKGGYSSKDEFVDHLVQQLKKLPAQKQSA
jgi:hypothetical protein